MPQPDPQAISIQARLDTWARNALPHVPSGSRGTLVRSWYAQQGFLARLAASPYAGQLIVGGAWSLTLARPADYSEQRVTRDLDVDVPQISDEHELRALLEAIISTRLPSDQEDHLEFEPLFTLKRVLPGTPAGGYRAVMHAHLGPNTRILFTLDVALQFEVVPAPEVVQVPRLLHPQASISVQVAPIEAVLSGKVASLLRNGFQTTRLKDFYDCWLASQRSDFVGDRMIAALEAVCQQQGVVIDPQAEVFSSSVVKYDAKHETRWQTFLQEHWIEAPDFPIVVQALRALYLPVIDRTAVGCIWQHQMHQWTSHY